MSDDFKFPEKKKPLTKEELLEMLKEQVRDGEGTPEFDLSGTETFTVFGTLGGMIHHLDYVDDPLFLDAVNAVLETEESSDKIVSKLPATITGYFLYNAAGEVIGFTCFDSQSGL